MELSRKIATGLLLTFVVFTAGYAVGKEVGVRRILHRMPAVVPGSVAGTPTGETPERRLVAWYYHSTKRCKKCNTIEAFGKEALETLFAAQMASGDISWQVANMDDVWNQDAVQRYGLLRSSLVLVDMQDGVEQDHSVLNRVWELTDDKETFFAFVESKVEMVIDGWAEAGDDESEEEE